VSGDPVTSAAQNGGSSTDQTFRSGEALTARQVGPPTHEQRPEEESIIFPSSVSTNLLLYLGDKTLQARDPV